MAFVFELTEFEHQTRHEIYQVTDEEPVLAQNPTPANLCNVCEKDAAKHCAKCKIVWYCSRECQRANWKQHKEHCQTPTGQGKIEVKNEEPVPE